MCLLWLLLQFIILAMYWDVPPVSSEEEEVLEMKREEAHEEEAPLMGSDEEATPSYKAVGERPIRGGSGASSPFRNFSASRGETANSLEEHVCKAIKAEMLYFASVEISLEGNLRPQSEKLSWFIP